MVAKKVRPKQHVSLTFASETTCISPSTDVVLLLDRNAGGLELVNMQSFAQRFVSTFDFSSNRLAIAQFGDLYSPLTEGFAASEVDALSALNRITPQGRRHTRLAIQQASQFLQTDQRGSPVVVVVTGGTSDISDAQVFSAKSLPSRVVAVDLFGLDDEELYRLTGDVSLAFSEISDSDVEGIADVVSATTSQECSHTPPSSVICLGIMLISVRLYMFFHNPDNH